MDLGRDCRYPLPWVIKCFNFFCSIFVFQALTTNFLGTMSPKYMKNKGFKSRLCNESPEWSGFIMVYPVSQDSTSLGLRQTRGQLKRKATAVVVVAELGTYPIPS